MVNQPHEDSQDPDQLSIDSVLDQITDEIRDVEVNGDAIRVTTWNAVLQKEYDIEIHVLDSGESLIVDNPEDDEDPLPLGLDNVEMQNGYFRTREYVMFDLKRFALSKPVRINPLHLTWLGSIEGAEELNMFGHRIRARSNDIIWGGDYLKMAGQALGIISKNKKGTPAKRDMLETLRALKIIAGIPEDQVNLAHKFKGFDRWKKKKKNVKNEDKNTSEELLRPEDVVISNEEPIKIADEVVPQDSLTIDAAAPDTLSEESASTESSESHLPTEAQPTQASDADVLPPEASVDQSEIVEQVRSETAHIMFEPELIQQHSTIDSTVPNNMESLVETAQAPIRQDLVHSVNASHTENIPPLPEKKKTRHEDPQPAVPAKKKNSSATSWVATPQLKDVHEIFRSYAGGTAVGNLMHNFLEMRKNVHSVLQGVGSPGSVAPTVSTPEAEKKGKESDAKTPEKPGEGQKSG